MSPAAFASQLTWLDWAVILALLAFVAAGMGRGFLLGALDLAGMVVSLGVAVLGYRQLAPLLMQYLGLSEAIATLGAFLALAVLANTIFAAVINALARVLGPILLLLGPLAILDRLLGAIPGLVKGLLVVTLALLPFALLPLAPPLSAAIERSTVASRLAVAAVDLAPAAESVLGRELGRGLAFLAPPQTEEGLRLHFGALGTLAPDPDAEAEMLQLLNQERARAGLEPLQPDERLRDVARAHSREMFELEYFAHDSPVSGSPADRVRQADIPFGLAGENLAFAPNVQVAHEGLMQSPGHRANILRPEFRRVGIGVIRSQFRGRMFTQEFTD
jgi:uncharacterized protein YkwD/uncharacterized membrane protein required for colicin V production